VERRANTAANKVARVNVGTREAGLTSTQREEGTARKTANFTKISIGPSFTTKRSKGGDREQPVGPDPPGKYRLKGKRPEKWERKESRRR